MKLGDFSGDLIKNAGQALQNAAVQTAQGLRTSSYSQYIPQTQPLGGESGNTLKWG